MVLRDSLTVGFCAVLSSVHILKLCCFVGNMLNRRRRHQTPTFLEGTPGRYLRREVPPSLPTCDGQFVFVFSFYHFPPTEIY